MNRKYILPVLILTGLILLTTGCTQTLPGKGTNYYLDAENGNDNQNGRSPEQAWKSLDKVKTLSLKAGDSLLLRRGTTFKGQLELSARGTSEKRIVIDAYGTGEKPCITAPDSSLYAVHIKNSDYVTLQNLEVVNTGSKRLPRRTGVKVTCENYGISNHIVLNALYIHDVNGSLIKKEGGGSGILIENRWDKDSTVSVFDSLTIENCVIRRCERNALIWNAPWSRKNWHLSTHTLVRKNLIEEVPGDGIVPIGCDSARIEYNLMRKCTALLPDGEAAAGIWPWSCDHTLIQFNEASDHKAPWDGQGFDSDYNCTHTTIQYNYSHDNDGGFILICNAGQGETDPQDNIGNRGSIVRYNISLRDAIRQRETRIGTFSPTIHISGPCKNTLVERNILHVGDKPSTQTDRSVLTSDSWGGYADSTFFRHNVFYASQPSTFRLGKSTHNCFENNFYLGTFHNRPTDEKGKAQSEQYETLAKQSDETFDFLFTEMAIGDGEAIMKVVDKQAIHRFFENLENGL